MPHAFLRNDFIAAIRKRTSSGLVDRDDRLEKDKSSNTE